MQKNLHAETFKISPMIIAKNPFMAAPELLILMGSVRPNGISLHVFPDSWWEECALPRALEAVKSYAMSWFEQAIREESDLTHVMEPTEPSSTTLPWAPPRVRTVGSRLYSLASLMHYLSGNRQEAVERTNDWIASLRPDGPERQKALIQVQALSRPN